MPKGSFWDDTFEKALEAGQSMAKSGGKQLKQTFDPRRMVENAISKGDSQSAMQKELQEAQAKKPNMTPLDFAKLQAKYQDQDNSKSDALRNRLFQMVKSGEEKMLQEKKQKDMEKKRQEMRERQEKERKEAQRRQQEAGAASPHGKERKSILGGKKKKGIEPSPAEIKPSTGKQ